MTLPGYFNRFDAGDHYDELLFRASKGLQSAELNEIQHTQIDRLKRIADKVFRDGQVLQGVDPIIDIPGGTITCPDATVYVRGAMREVAGDIITIPMVGLVRVGVFLLSEEITEDDEATLRDPAPNTRNYNEPGAGRLRVTSAWGREGFGSGEFYPVYTLVDGNLLSQNTPPDNNVFFEALARYDRESNGNYIVDGLSIDFISLTNGNNILTVKDGVGNIQGYKVDKKVSTRLVYAEDPDLEVVTSEPDVFTSATGDPGSVQLNRFPLSSITEVVATLEKTVSLTRGGSVGGLDTLPDVSVLSIQSITQGGTTYQSPRDYLLNGDRVDWSPTGGGAIEPAPGSTYSITYRYLANVTPTQVDLQNGTLAVTGPVQGTLVLTDYIWKLPRYDRIGVNQSGEFVRVKGVSTRFNPLPPAAPSTLLSLATLEHRWGVGPLVTNDGVRAIPFNQLERMRQLIVDLFDLVALERLQLDVSSREPTTKRGVFVDPFLDDDLRDQGLAQTASSSGGILTLAIDATAYQPPENNGQDWTLAFTEEIVLSQTRQTGWEKINPYQVFEPLPAIATLTPAVDRWQQIETNWLSAITQIFNRGSGTVVVSETWTRRQELVSVQRQAARFLREIEVSFQLAGFDPGEQLATVAFDDITVTPY